MISFVLSFSTTGQTKLEILKSYGKPMDGKAKLKKDGKQAGKQEENKADEEPAPVCTIDDEFIKNQFEMQREFNNSVLRKLKVTDNLMSLVREQQSQIVSLVGMFK